MVGQTITVTVNYDSRQDAMPGEDWTSAGCRQDTVSRRSGTQTVEIILWYFDRKMLPKEVADALAANGQEPITPEELRALEACDDVNLPRFIAALGTSWVNTDNRGRQHFFFSCLNTYLGRRSVHLYRLLEGGDVTGWVGARRQNNN